MLKKKEIILKAAAILFSEKGFKDTSMSELSKATGIAEGTIFYHFKNKEDILLSILDDIKNRIVKEFSDYLKDKETQAKNGLGLMEEIISFYLYLAGMMENRFLILHHYYPYKLAEENTICRNHLEEIYNFLLNIFENAIKKGQSDGSIGLSHDRKTALLIFSMVDGVVRFKNYNLYESSSLYNELINLCKKLLKN
ncbi:MAG: TetR/AcrR family transcriptional regulator [Desulfobacterales bacterium]|nr:TetR/AcrR family transcriptional regulator [Desulfobacterales bacterium]